MIDKKTEITHKVKNWEQFASIVAELKTMSYSDNKIISLDFADFGLSLSIIPSKSSQGLFHKISGLLFTANDFFKNDIVEIKRIETKDNNNQK